MKQLLSALLLSVSAVAAATPPVTPATERTPALAGWEAMKYGAFIHFGMSTFTQDQFGKKPATLDDYNPTALDVDQWVRVIRDAGMKYALLTAKHCYGHCLWPSKFSDNTVANSPIKTDVVREYVDACRKHGIKPGLYYLLGWDWENQKRMTPDEYEAFCINQLTELLTDYGPIYEIWLDIPWDMGPDTAARLARIYAACKKAQPECLVLLNQSFYNGIAPRSKTETWMQQETGGGEVLIWPSDLMNGEESCPPSSGHVPGITVNGVKHYLPMETQDCLNKSWFWIKGENPKPLSWLASRHRAVVGKNVNWILNIGPDPEGKIPQEQIDALMALKKAIENPSSYLPLNLRAKTTASNIYQNDPAHGPDAAVDDLFDTRWATDAGTTSAWLEVDLGKPLNIGRAAIMQASPELKRIRKFAIEYKHGDTWKVCYQGEDPDPWLDVTFDPVSAQHFRLNILESTDGPTISEFQLYPPAASD